jgi:hypothetical protein
MSDELDDHPALRELQEASRATILRAIQKPGTSVVKATVIGPPRDEVRGYATLARFFAGATPEQLE